MEDVDGSDQRQARARSMQRAVSDEASASSVECVARALRAQAAHEDVLLDSSPFRPVMQPPLERPKLPKPERAEEHDAVGVVRRDEHPIPGNTSRSQAGLDGLDQGAPNIVPRQARSTPMRSSAG